MPKLIWGRDAGAEVRSAIESGKEVTFHESSINLFGWHRIRYIITDSDTGSGVYLIEGGGNGAILFILGMIVAMGPAIIARVVLHLLLLDRSFF